jgi:RHS repeat-associated protein
VSDPCEHTFEGSRPSAARTDGSIPHGDHLGSSQLFTDETGVLTHVQRFDPFGAPIDSGSTPDATSARIRAGFTGHETDVETGLVNMGGRLYDPRIGRVLQADPPFMESPLWSQGLNRYSYVFNNPLNAIDPSGFMTEHDHPEDEDVEVTESIDPGTGVTTYEQPDIVEESESSTEEAETSPSEDPDDDEGLDDDALDDTGETLSSSQDDGFPQIPDFLDWIGGFGLGYAQGMVPGGTFLPIPPGSDGYQLSVALGQLVGGLNALQTGATVATGGGLATATGVGSPVGVPTIAAGAAVAVGGGVNVANAVGNIVKMGGGDDPPASSAPAAADAGQPQATNPAQDKILSKGEIKMLEAAGHHPHSLKPKVGGSKFDLYKTANGDIVVKPKGGRGEGDPTGININDL